MPLPNLMSYFDRIWARAPFFKSDAVFDRWTRIFPCPMHIRICQTSDTDAAKYLLHSCFRDFNYFKHFIPFYMQSKN